MSVPLGRETIWAAFWALLSPLAPATFVTASRRLKHYDDVPAEQQPALFLLQKNERGVAKDRGLPTAWRLYGELYVYARSDPGVPTSGGQVLNPLIDAIEGALAPVPAQGNVQSLGGTVSRAIIDYEREIEVFEGNLDSQAVAIIPVLIIGPV